MDNSQSATVNAEDNSGIPDDLRCKRSEGKQWRCTAMSMSGKTVCEKHYYQAKKRALSSAMRARLKKNSKSLGESDIYLESKSDDFDMPLENMKIEKFLASGSTNTAKRHKKKTLENNGVQYSPENTLRNWHLQSSARTNENMDEDEFDESWRLYNMPPDSAMDLSRSRRSIITSDIRSTNTSDMMVGTVMMEPRNLMFIMIFLVCI